MDGDGDYEPNGSPTGPPQSGQLQPPTMPNYELAGLARKGRRPGTKNREGHKAGGPRPGAGRRPKPRGTARPEAAEGADREWEAKIFENGYDGYSSQSPPQSPPQRPAQPPPSGHQPPAPDQSRSAAGGATPGPSRHQDQVDETSRHRRRSSIYKVLNMPVPYPPDHR